MVTYGLLFDHYGKRGKKYYCVLIFFIIIFLAMFRSYEVGNDVKGYTRIYELIASGAPMETMGKRFELGFLYLCKSLSYISSNSQFLLITYGAFVLGTIGCFIYRFSLIPWISVLMFFCLFLDNTLSVMRQGLALSFVLISFFYLNKGRILTYFLWNIVALLFHNAALIFFLAYPLSIISRYNSALKILGFTGTCLFFLLFNPIINLVMKIFPKYHYYVGSTYLDGRLRIGTFALLFIIGMFYTISYHFDKKYRISIKQIISDRKSALSERGYNTFSNLGFLSCLVIACSFKSTIIGRFSGITSIFLICYYPNMLVRVSNRHISCLLNLILMTMIVVYRIIVIIYRPEWNTIYPYKFFWSN